MKNKSLTLWLDGLVNWNKKTSMIYFIRDISLMKPIIYKTISKTSEKWLKKSASKLKNKRISNIQIFVIFCSAGNKKKQKVYGGRKSFCNL